jgi:predicted solute-binding protein
MIRLGITNDFISLPMTTELSASIKNSQFQIRNQSLEKNYVDLTQGKLDAAFISPVDYGKDSSLLKILKDFAIYNRGESRYVLLFFRKNLNEIEEVVFKAISHYNNIALIVLNEFFEIDPVWKLIKQNKNIDVLLKSYPAVLQNGEEAMNNYFKLDTKIDVIGKCFLVNQGKI